MPGCLAERAGGGSAGSFPALQHNSVAPTRGDAGAGCLRACHGCLAVTGIRKWSLCIKLFESGK